MSCVEHPDREGKAQCDQCGALMCDRCVTHSAEGWPGSCAACKRKARAARPARPAEPPTPPWPRRPLFIAGVVLLLASAAAPLALIVDAVRSDPAMGVHESPAQMGSAAAIGLEMLGGFCLSVWLLAGLIMFFARWRFARFFLAPYFALFILPLVLSMSSGRPDVTLAVAGGYGVLMLTWLFGSRTVKDALFR